MPVIIEISDQEEFSSHFSLVHMDWFHSLVHTVYTAVDEVTHHRLCGKLIFHKLESWTYRNSKTFRVPAPPELCREYMKWAGWPQFSEKAD